MAFGSAIIARAEARLKQEQQAHETRRNALRESIYEALPRTRAIDLQLRQTAPRLMAAALQGDPEALEDLKRENLALQAEEAALLQTAGYPADALDDLPLCPLCGDRGWQGAAMCSCLKTLCQQEQIRDLSSMLDLGDKSFDAFRLDYYDRETDPKYRRSPRENMEAVLTNCRNYAEQFDIWPHRNLLLFGDPGLGKTYLSACIARVVSDKGYSVVYDTASNVFSRMETRKFSRDPEEGRQAEEDTRRYLSCDLLIVDDLGSEFTSPFIQSALYELVNTRLIESRRTVISSNLNREELRKRYTPQVASRLEGEYLALPFFGRDIRLLKKQRRQS